MLSPSDAALSARDPALPGLASLLDPVARAALTGRDDLRVTYLRYKPGTSCMVGLAPRDGTLSAMAAIAVTADRWPELRARPKWQGGHVGFHDAVHVALVPLRTIRHVAAHKVLTDPARRTTFCAALGLADAPMCLLRFKPERRLVLQVATTDGTPALLKCHSAAGFDRAVQGARHAAAHAGAPLLAVDAAHHAILSGWIDGAALDPALGPDAFRATGAALARLHAIPAADLHPITRAVDAADCATATRATAQLWPALAARTAAVATRVAARLQAAPLVPCTIHGDFSADQVILQGAVPVILDWDRIAAGDAGRDLGGFLARLDVDVLEGRLSAAGAAMAGQALLAGYAGHAPLPATLPAQRARALLALATEGFRHRAPDWPARIAAVLTLSEDALAGDDAPPPAAPIPAAPDLAATPGLRVALDPDLMRDLVAPAFGADGTTGLTATLLRHKPGRRALIRYATGTTPPRVRLAKLRAKGPDHRTPGLHDALRAAGLDGRAPHRVGVPEAFGSLTAPPLWLQAQVDGATLTDALLAGAGPDAAARAGAALAALHATNVATDRDWHMADEVAVLDKALSQAAALLPGQAAAIAAVGTAARALAFGLPPGVVAGIHRDFHPDQVLLGDPVTWLLDLDLHARGDGAVDLGNMLAHLTELGLRTTGAPDRFRAHADALVAGYGGADRAGGAARIAALHAVSLARHIFISRRFQDRHHTTAPLIALCARMLDR